MISSFPAVDRKKVPSFVLQHPPYAHLSLSRHKRLPESLSIATLDLRGSFHNRHRQPFAHLLKA
jgi:hypothetical protein